MKKIFLAGLLSILAVSANADSWEYELIKNDFDGDTKSASIHPDKSEIELIVIKNDESNSRDKHTVAFLLPRGILTSSNCKTCGARVIADGKEVDSIRLLEASNFRTYYLYSDKDYFLDLFQNNSIVKIQLPTYRSLETLTFTQSKPLSLQELESVQ
jgi:hypothetical protein